MASSDSYGSDDPSIKPGLVDRLRSTFLKPVEPGAVEEAPVTPRSVEELEEDIRVADDTERLLGLVAAPMAAALGILIINLLISHDPAQYLKGGLVNPQHVSVSLYHSLTLVLLGLAVLMLVMGWLRKRLFLGIVMSLYGLAVFNLHYWGFGIPFILGGAWLLVRAYRAQRELRVATGDLPSRRAGGGSTVARPRANKRYTPPT
jgi:hypothetical protein